MPILVTCRTCNRRFNAPDAAAGKKTNCPNCSDIIEIPSAAPAEEILDAEEELRPAAHRPRWRRRSAAAGWIWRRAETLSDVRVK